MTLKKRTLAAYGQIALPLAIADLPLVVYLTTFYGGDIGIPLQTMAFVLLLARGLDVLIDPMIGILSDRSGHWPLGRRKSWVLIGVPLKMIGIYFIFFATPGVGAGYMLVWLIVLYLGWTMIQTPYGAWGAELSGDYLERTRVTGWRTLFAFVGILIATLAPLITGGGAGTPQGLTPVMQGLGLWAIVMFPISAAIIGYFVPEPPVRNVGRISWLQGIRAAARNGPYMRILISTTIGRIGAAINTTVVLWFFIFAMGLGVNGGWPVLVYLIFAVVGIPLWVMLGDRFTKHNTLIFAVVASILAFSLLLALPRGDLLSACLVMAAAGLGGGAAGTLGLSIAADVLDLEELRSRQSRAGLLFAFWNMGGKLADAIGGFLALMAISAVGFDPRSLANGPDAIWGLTMTYIIVPWPFFLVSVLLLWRFPIDRARQLRIRKMIDRRAARLAAAPAE